MNAPCASAQAFVLADTFQSYDTDALRTDIRGAGAGAYINSANNFYDRIGYRRASLNFTAPGFSRKGSSDTLLGYKQLSTLFGRMNGELALTTLSLDGWQRTSLGALQIAGRPTERSGYELRRERNLVESPMGLTNQVTYTANTLALDHELTPLFSLAGVAGQLDFTDGNTRRLLKGRVTYVFAEEYGMRAYLKTAHQHNSQPNNGNYFSPGTSRDYQAGLGMRRRVGSLRGMLSVSAEWGAQVSDGTRIPVHAQQVRLEAFLNRPWYFDIALGNQTSSGTGGGANYVYRYARASLIYPI